MNGCVARRRLRSGASRAETLNRWISANGAAAAEVTAALEA
jgi:hypothetical protein